MIYYITRTLFMNYKKDSVSKKCSEELVKETADNDRILEEMATYKKNKRMRDHMMDLLITNLKAMQ